MVQNEIKMDIIGLREEDDVLNVSGHRLGSGEIENVVVEHADIATAVVGIPHDIKGQGIFVYAIAETAKLMMN